MEIALALAVIPANVLIPRRTEPGGRPEAKQGQRLLPGGVNEVAQLCPRQRFVAEVMVALDRLVPKTRIGFVFDPLKVQWR